MIKRYDFERYANETPDERGTYVLYSDHEREVGELRDKFDASAAREIAASLGYALLERKHQALELALADMTRQRDEVLAMDTPWPLEIVLDKLSEAVGHLLTHHGCDQHGHEGLRVAQTVGRAMAGRVRAVLARNNQASEVKP